MADVEDLATGVYAGTSKPAGVEALIIDRSDLPEDVRVFVRPVDPGLMQLWTKIVKGNAVLPSLPLLADVGRSEENGKNSDQKGGGLKVTLLDPVRLCIRGGKGEALLIHAAAGSRIEVLSACDLGEPKLSLGRVQSKEVIFFDGGVPAIELPMRLAAKQYAPLVLGVSRPANQHFNKELRASQRNGEGILSGGYSIVV